MATARAVPRRMMLRPGAVVAGRFRVRCKIAAGGMGEVWSGEHRATGLHVALKTLLPEFAKKVEVVRRLKREAELLACLRSDRVARVIDFVVDPSYGPILVTEFVEGRSLAEVLASDTFGVEDAIDVGIEIASALRELHRAHIVHRDLKPGNVILQPAADGHMRAVIVDLGVSRLVSHGEDQDNEFSVITASHVVLGTIAYMAPEQLVEAHDVTETADLYSLGAILFRMVTGRQVFGGLPRTRLVRTKLEVEAPRLETGRGDPVALGLEVVVSRALQTSPVGRYTTADAMLSDLCRIRELGNRERERLPAPSGGPRRATKHLTWRATALASLAIALAIGGAASALSCSRTSHSTTSHATVEAESVVAQAR